MSASLRNHQPYTGVRKCQTRIALSVRLLGIGCTFQVVDAALALEQLLLEDLGASIERRHEESDGFPKPSRNAVPVVMKCSLAKISVPCRQIRFQAALLEQGPEKPRRNCFQAFTFGSEPGLSRNLNSIERQKQSPK